MYEMELSKIIREAEIRINLMTECMKNFGSVTQIAK